MEQLLDKKVQELTVREYLMVLDHAKKNKKIPIIKKDTENINLKQIIENNYVLSNFLTPFGEIYKKINLQYPNLNQKELAIQLRKMGFKMKFKRMGNSTARCYSAIDVTSNDGILELEQFIKNTYDYGCFYFHYVRFSDIHEKVINSYKEYISKKDLTKTLERLGFTSKVKAVKGGSTARFYYMVAKDTTNEQ